MIEFGTPEIALASIVFASAFSPPKHFCTRLPSRTSAMAKVGLAEKHADSETLQEFVAPLLPPPPPLPPKNEKTVDAFDNVELRALVATAMVLDANV